MSAPVGDDEPLEPYPPTPEPDPQSLLSHGVILDEIDNSRIPLPPDEEKEFQLLADELTTIPYCPWKPNEGPQTMFLLDFGREALYGGGAGAGKSIAILMAASQFLSVPGYSALILRKSFRDLDRPGALMDIAEEWWRGKPGIRFDIQERAYYFDCPGGGRARTVFGSLDDDNDRFKYQGGAYHFCISKGSPILMGDSTWRAIEDVAVGDEVMTLEGPKPVTHTHSLGIKPVESLTTSSGATVRISASHRFLTPDGWSDAASIRSRESFGTPASSTAPCPISPTRPESTLRGLPPAHELPPQLRAGNPLRATGACSATGRSDSEESGGSRQEPPRPPTLSVPVVLHEQGLRQSGPGIAPWYPGRECVHERSGPSQPQGSPSGCHNESGSGDEPVPDRPVAGPRSTRPQGDVGSAPALGDGPGNTPARTRQGSCDYAHPYTKEERAATHAVSVASVSMAPAGEAECFDLTVAEVAHYVTWGGIVASNCGFDELTQHKERDYRYLFSRMRRVKDGPLARIPLRMRSTANPGGIGHEWVLRRFIAPWEAWKLGDADRPTRNFHPALLADNPKLDYADYVESLNELDPITRAQLLRGDWNIRPDGRMFKREWFKPIKRSELPGDCRWVRFWDMASTDPAPGGDPDYTVGTRVGRSPQGAYYIDNMVRWRKEPAESDTLCHRTAMADTRQILEAMEQEPGASGKIAIHHYRTGAFAGSNFRGVPSSGKSRSGTSIFTSARTSQGKITAAMPVASQADAGNVFIVVDGTWDHEALLSEMEVFPDAGSGGHDDIADTLSGAFALLAKMHMYGLDFGQASTGLTHDYQWRPDAMPSSTLARDDGWMGGRIVEEREMMRRMEQEMREERMAVEGAFSME